MEYKITVNVHTTDKKNKLEALYTNFLKYDYYFLKYV